MLIFSSNYKTYCIYHYSVNDNIITANLSPDYGLSKSLTIDVELPEGYFVNGSNTYGIKSLLLCIICIVFAVISFVMWIKNGKDFWLHFYGLY